MQKGRGGMGSHKHGVSGRVPKNRRALRLLAVEINKTEASVKKKKDEMFGSMGELMKHKK